LHLEVAAGNVWPVPFGHRSWLPRAFLASSFLALGGCSGQGGGAREGRTPAVSAAPERRTHAAARLDVMPSERMTLVPDGTFGPYVGARTEGTIAAWAAEMGGKREWRTMAIADGAKPLGQPKVVADAAPEVNLVAVKPLGEGQLKAFLLVSSAREFSGERVDAMALGLHGELLGGPTPIAQSLTDVVWLDAVQTASGAIAMWAVRRGDRADLFGVEVGPSGDVRDRPSQLFADARAWQVAKSGGGVVIAAVTAGKAHGENGPLRVAFVDAQGHLEKKSLLLTDGGTAEPDVDLARIGNRTVVAWSDRRDLEPRLYAAVLGPDSALLKPPAPLGPPFGTQALLRIVPPSDHGAAYLAWENLIERPENGRAIRLAQLSEDGTLGSSVGLLSMARGDAMPELSANDHGVAALTLAPACKRGGPCGAEPPVPTYVALDTQLDVVASEPLRLTGLDGALADLAWGLTCRALECTALASGPGTPAPVVSVQLQALVPGGFEPAARRVTSDPPPRVTEIVPIAKSEPVAELATAPVADGTLVAWVTDFDPTTPFSRSKVAAPDGKFEPPRAIVRVRSVPRAGIAPEPVAISYRAHSLGGVAIAAGDPAIGEALLAWAGVDNKEPEIFVTMLGPGGKKVSQKMLTHVKGGVSDVAATFVGDGFVVGWIEEHSGASEVHVTRLERTLKVVVPDKRLSGTASTATSIQLVTRGEHVFAVWSDARGPSSGVADIFALSLATKDLSPVGTEHRLAQTPGHSRSPAVAPFGEGAAVTWVEDSASEGDGKTATLMVVRLDSGAEPIAGSVRSVLPGGAPEGVAIECGSASCRVAAAVTLGQAGAVTAFDFRPSSGDDIRPARLVRLAAPPREAIAPVLRNGDVLYADQSAPEGARVRRLGVAWE
jgi:hypothetical protein